MRRGAPIGLGALHAWRGPGRAPLAAGAPPGGAAQSASGAGTCPAGIRIARGGRGTCAAGSGIRFVSLPDWPGRLNACALTIPIAGRCPRPVGLPQLPECTGFDRWINDLVAKVILARWAISSSAYGACARSPRGVRCPSTSAPYTIPLSSSPLRPTVTQGVPPAMGIRKSAIDKPSHFRGHPLGFLMARRRTQGNGASEGSLHGQQTTVVPARNLGARYP